MEGCRDNAKRRRRADMRTSSSAVSCKRRASVRSFKDVVRCMDGVRHRGLLEVSEEPAAGMFDVLSDDCVAQVMKSVLAVAPAPLGKTYVDSVGLSREAFCALAVSCKRVCNLIRQGYHHLQAEALARGSTRIIPRRPFAEDAFTVQMRAELASCDHLKMLRAAQNAMACHCASSCCKLYMRAFNNDVRNGNVFSRPPSPTMASTCPQKTRLVSVLENCTSIAVGPSGDVAFAYMRERASKRRVSTNEGRASRFREVIVRVRERRLNKNTSSGFAMTNKLRLDECDMSPPLAMRCSPSGNSVVFTRSEHDVDPASASAFGGAFLWTANHAPARVEAPRGCSPGVPETSLSAQDCWFAEVQSGEEALVVAWSTDFVHTSGHHLGSHAGEEGPLYFFATYLIDQGTPEFYEATFAEKGCLLTCSPSASGTTVVTLAKQRAKKEVHLHDIRSGLCKSILGSPLVPFEGPVCVSLSPSGDAVVAVHKPARDITVTVHVVNDAGSFSPVQRADVTPYLALHATGSSTDLVKRSLCVEFSPCSRFAAIVDGRPAFGKMAENHGVVVLDMALRQDESLSLRPYPMFATADQCPRGFQWTRRGIWLLPPGTDDRGAIGPRGGALCLLAAAPA